ncbi:MAG: endo-1,3(4)-beta-glucanase [Marinilabiliales bacterium]|nr:MAG: endo-1,3(4)-beta-glucanase [Marinilabiliales bacterium]
MHIYNNLKGLLKLSSVLLIIFSFELLSAQIVDVGDGSYTTQFPGVDAAGRNTYPSGTPFISGNATSKPVPTNDWWSSKIKNSHSDNLFNYPFTLKTVNQGLVATYIPWGVIDDIMPVTIGVEGLNSSVSNVVDYSDWLVSMEWSNGEHNFTATSGIGMPFLYFTKNTNDIAKINVTSGNVTVLNELLIITDVRNGADFAVYAPEGSVWTQNAGIYTSDLNGKNYWSLAFIPLDASNITDVATEYKKYAFVFPSNTRTSWNYDNSTSIIRTDFIIDTEVKEGSDTAMLIGLLPHQWANLSADSPSPDLYSYATVRGELKTMGANSFSVENTFYGILPTMPYLDNYSDGFNPQKLDEKVKQLENDGLSTWTDSYNEGQMMNRLIQTARVADLTGNTIARDKIINTVKTRLEDWLSANLSEVAFLFYYNDTWSAMIGYPAGHGQDGNLNDHHFHWGYFIHAASFIEQFEPGWSEQWGGMINLLVRDAASSDRNDEMFPFLRNFSPYAGHCWANGFATFPQGNDQESTSESMQFNSSLIHWGTITGNDEIRDLGIYLYTTEQSAIEEYWFDMYNRNFGPNQQYRLVSRVWGNSYDNGTFWTSDIAASYGIEMYPIHGGSLYLGHNIEYVNELWNEIEDNTGILENEANDNLWHDIMWQYLSFTNPQQAINLYDSYPDRSLKFGVSDAQTYHWLHSMNVLGNVNPNISADYPIAAAFTKDGETIYTAHNYNNQDISVNFSDGYILEVPANTMATSLDIPLKGIISSSYSEAFPGGSIDLSVQVDGGTPTNVEFYIDGEIIGQMSEPPFIFTADNLQLGTHSCYAKIYDGSNFNLTNLIPITVGSQVSFVNEANEIPGSIFAGNYDKFEGGIGQGISYSDVSINNNGDYRLNEYVDASLDFNEGAVVGWISSGEWLEYTIYVQEAGYYSLNFRYACGNQSGGGPFDIESDNVIIAQNISVSYTGDWDNWSNKTINNVALKSGKQILRLYFNNGELNLGEMNFTYESPLDYNQPIADAGENLFVVLPQTSGSLDGSNSSDPDGTNLNYTWTQIYGPSELIFSDNNSSQPIVSSLEEGVYLVKLKVDNGSYFDEDEVYVISSSTTNLPPNVAINYPLEDAVFIENDAITISAYASDLNGYIDKVEFFVNGEYLSTVFESPYTTEWTSSVGEYQITAVAYDNEGMSSESEPVNIELTPAPSCYGSSFNGEFNYEFSPDDNNPTLTFIPSVPGVGNPTCILYYGTNANSLPGYHVTPNQPYQINASEGTKIYFYYTYSYPGQGEHNNSANMDTYEIGSCLPSAINDYEKFRFSYFPNPVINELNLTLPSGTTIINVFNLQGKLLDEIKVYDVNYTYDMSDYNNGIYIFRLINNKSQTSFKIIK